MIRQRSDVKFWIQTKRAERMKDNSLVRLGDGWENVILMTQRKTKSKVG